MAEPKPVSQSTSAWASALSIFIALAVIFGFGAAMGGSDWVGVWFVILLMAVVVLICIGLIGLPKTDR